MFLVLLALLSVIIALIRKGSVANIIGNGTKAWYLFIISILGFVALRVGDAMGIQAIQQYSMVITLASYSILLLGAILNLVNLWMFPVLIGALMNFVVIFINGGKMPVSLQAMEIAHIAKEVVEASSSMSVATTSTTLPYLCGIIPIPLPWIFAEVISPGTLIIGVGLFAIIQNILMGVVYEYDYEDDDDEYYDDYEEEEEDVEEKKKPSRKKKPEPEEATDALAGKDYTEEIPGEQEDIKNIVDEGLSDELGDLLKPDDLFDLDSLDDTIPVDDEDIKAPETDGTEEAIVMPESDDNVLDVSDFGSDEIPELSGDDQPLVEMDDFTEIIEIPEDTKIEDFPDISEIHEENEPEQTEESLSGEDVAVPEKEEAESGVSDQDSEEFTPELPETTDKVENDVSEEDFTLDDGTQLRLDDFEAEDIEDLIPVYDDEPGEEDNIELSAEDDYQEDAPADDTGIPVLPDIEEEDAVAEQFDDAFENRDFDEDIIFDTGSFDVGTSLPSEIKEEIPDEPEAVKETEPVEEHEPAVKPEIESAESAEVETAPPAEPVQQTVSVPVDEPEPEVKPEVPVFKVPEITPKPEVEKTEENISEYFARLALEDFPEDGTSQPAVHSDSHVSMPVRPAAPEPVRVTEPVKPAAQERPFDQSEYRVIHDENSESQVVEKTLEKMDYIMDKGPLRTASSSDTESVAPQQRTAPVSQAPAQTEETPIDTDSPYIIKDGKIIENPYYKFKKTSPVKPLDFVERFSRTRSQAGGYQPAESRKTEPEPETPRRSRYEEITFDKIYSSDSSSNEKEPVGNVEMKIGDVQITFYKKDEK